MGTTEITSVVILVALRVGYLIGRIVLSAYALVQAVKTGRGVAINWRSGSITLEAKPCRCNRKADE
jgi:hypothetical protein